jgi:P pilus assembly chaperone PapD
MTENFEPTGTGANGTFDVYNSLGLEVAVTVTIKARKIDAEGLEILTGTKDLAVFPTEMMIKGKSINEVRVKWQGTSSLRSERSYRIIAEESQLKYSGVQPSGPFKGRLKPGVSYSGTIYVAPPKARANIVIAEAKRVETPGGAMLALDLENRGSRHAIIDKPSLTVKVGAVTRRVAEAELDKALDGMNILVEGKRHILVPWPAGLPAGTLEAKLDASFLR